MNLLNIQPSFAKQFPARPLLNPGRHRAFLELEEALHQQFLKKKNQPKRRHAIKRNRVEGNIKLREDYFNPDARYPPYMFERRFRMSKNLFERLVSDLGVHSQYWTQRVDCCGQIGLSPSQKITCAIRHLAYGCPADATDEYIQIGETTAIQTLKKFVNDVVEVYGNEYCCGPTDEELQLIMKEYEDCGFPGCCGSIDGMNWVGKTVLKLGQVNTKEKKELPQWFWKQFPLSTYKFGTVFLDLLELIMT